MGSSLESIGITYDELLNNAATSTNRRLFIVAMDLEKVLEAGYSGVDTGGGKALLFDVKNLISGTDATTIATRCDIIMHHEAAISITESGVHVSY